ncbi:MAG TPA: VOC family protein [Terricaulis sp.]|nr:VOC family protein [Terricaulis sp.]HRP12312.1 VOC family protein [Terricaulis sp.]
MRLNQITAPAHDLAASIAFYQTLGLKLIVKSDRYARFELPKGEATFSLHIVDGDIPQANAPQLYFEVHDVSFEVERLTRAGLTFETEPADQRWLWREAWLRDPAGNALCIYHAGHNRRFPPWRIDVPETPRHFHIIIREGAEWALAKLEGDGEAWRLLQDEYADYKASLGPFTLIELLQEMEFEWPEILRQHEAAIRAFAAGGDARLVF